MVGKHNFQMENFLQSDVEDSEKINYESIIDHQAIKEYSSFAQDKHQLTQDLNNQNLKEGAPNVMQVSFSDHKINSSVRNASLFRDFKFSCLSKFNNSSNKHFEERSVFIDDMSLKNMFHYVGQNEQDCTIDKPFQFKSSFKMIIEPQVIQEESEEQLQPDSHSR